MKFRVVFGLILSLLVSNIFAENVFKYDDANITKTTKNVVVVGSGMAGLASAITLIDNGCNVTLLESDNKVGGKLYSEELGGIKSNLGAQYIYEAMHPIIDYYMNPIRTKKIRDLKSAYIKNGNFHHVGLFFLLKLIGDINIIAQDRASSLGLKNFYFDKDPQNALWNQFEAMSAENYLNNFQTALDPDVVDFISASLVGEAGGDISNLTGIIPVGWYGDLDQGSKFLLKDGNDSLADAIKDDFVLKGGVVLFNKSVTNVSINGSLVDIACSDNSTYSADYVVVATPAYVTKNIVSGLSTAKQTALDNVEYAPIAIVSLYVKDFPTGDVLDAVLYMDENINGFINQTGSIFDIGNSDRYRLQKTTVVNSTVTDPTMLAMNDNDLVAAVGDEIEKSTILCFNPDNDIIDYSIKRFTNGIVKFPTQYLTTNQSDLQSSVSDMIFFAGDYMYSPDLSGAAWAGQRAAQEILAQ
jgi:protoporphyrinogen oxidase